MSKKISIGYAGQVVDLVSGETVLDCLERNGFEVRSSCRTGACQSCMLRATEGVVHANAQKPLGSGLRSQGYFLACQFRPDGPISCVPADDVLPPIAAEVRHLERLSADIVGLHLDVPSEFKFRGGQFVHLERSDGLTRSYSIANLPTDGCGLELHVRKIPKGVMSAWIHDEVRPGDKVTLRGPVGDCTYDSVVEEEPVAAVGNGTSQTQAPPPNQRPLVLAGVGTGMAPLLAVAREAVARGHEGPIRVYQGGLVASRLYLIERFDQLLAQHKDAYQLQCVLQGPAEGKTMRSGQLADLVLEDLGKLIKEATAILCGDAIVVNNMRKKLFLAGVSMRRLHADAFVSATPAPAPAPIRAVAP